MFKLLLIILLCTFSVKNAVGSMAALVAAVQVINETTEAAETLENVNEVFELFGENGDLKEMLEVLDATNDLAMELGDEDELNNVAPTNLERELKKINSRLKDLGYTKNEVNQLLGTFEGDQKTVAGKIKTLRRSIRAMKNVRKSVSKLLGSKAADSVATQASAQIQTQNLHVNTKIYERMVLNDLKDKEKVLTESKKNEKILEDMLISLNGNLKKVQKKNKIAELKYEAIDLNFIKEVSVPISGLIFVLGGIMMLFVKVTRVGVGIVVLCAVSFLFLQLLPGVSSFAKKTVLSARAL